MRRIIALGAFVLVVLAQLGGSPARADSSYTVGPVTAGTYTSDWEFCLGSRTGVFVRGAGHEFRHALGLCGR